METRLVYVFATAALLLQPMATLAAEVELVPPIDSTGATENTDDLMDMSLNDLMNVTVTTTSKGEEKISDAPGVISVMSRDELKRFGARTLKDVLTRMPSTALSAIYMTERSTVAIRGDQLSPASNHILLLINGVDDHAGLKLLTDTFSQAPGLFGTAGDNMASADRCHFIFHGSEPESSPQIYEIDGKALIIILMSSPEANVQGRVPERRRS